VVLSGPTRGGEYTGEVRNMRMASAEARIAAVEELFVAVEAVTQSYRSLPEDERNERLNTDAALITGEVARLLAIARARISADTAPALVTDRADARAHNVRRIDGS
jgi:hypothetical protein